MDRFFKGIDFIERNLNEKLTVEDIAKASYYSTFHFCRMFKALVGDSVMEYVRKRRLSVAAERLVKEDIRLIDLAFDCQYESHEAFSRAFKTMFQLSPKEYRKLNQPMKLRHREKFSLDELNHLRKGIVMKPKFMEKEGFMVIGLLGNFDEDTKHNIPKLWERFSKEVKKIPNRKGAVSFGICECDNIHEGDFRYISAVEVSDLESIPEGMVGRKILKQKYAVFTVNIQKDIHQEIQKAIKYIWGTWFPKSEYKYAGDHDFELYDERFNGGTVTGELDIYIPIKNKS